MKNPVCIVPDCFCRFACHMFLTFLLIPSSAQSLQAQDKKSDQYVIDSLIQSCRILFSQKNYDDALSVIEEAEKRTEAVEGTVSSLYAKCLYNHGRVLQLTPQQEMAVDYYRRAKSIWDSLQIYGPDYESNLNNMGVLLQNYEQFDEAESCLHSLIELRRNKNQASYSTALLNLAGLYIKIGRYDEAQSLIEEILVIRSEKPGKNSLPYARAQNLLGACNHRAARFVEAETAYETALKIVRDSLGENHWEYGILVGSLGQLYTDFGEYDKAERLLLQSMSILGKKQAQYWENQNNLALLYYNQNRLSESESLFKESLSSREALNSRNSLPVAQSLDNLACVYSATGRFNEAIKNYLEALDIRKNKLGVDNLQYAANLGNLGVCYYLNHQYNLAESALLSALSIQKKLWRGHHPQLALALRNLALLYEAMKNVKKSANYFLEANIQYRALIEEAAIIYGENALLAALTRYQPFFDEFQSFAVATNNPALLETTLDNTLYFKDLLLEKQRRVTQTVAGADPEIRELYKRWKSARQFLAEQYVSATLTESGIQRLEAHADVLENRLNTSLQGWMSPSENPTWKTIQSHLRPHEAAVEFVRYKESAPYNTDRTQYGAYVMMDGQKTLQFIPLCESAAMEKIIFSNIQPAAARVQAIYDPAVSSEAQSLYDLTWTPLQNLFAANKIQVVYFAPAGLLHMVNNGALAPGENQLTLSQRYQMVQLGSTRHLITENSGNVRVIASAAIYGGLYYDKDSLFMKSQVEHYKKTPGDSQLSSDVTFQKTSFFEGEGNKPFIYLNGTDSLAERLNVMLKGKGVSTWLLQGNEGTEESIKELGNLTPSPGLFLIATHGFFHNSTTSSRRLRGQINEINDRNLLASSMLRSGLVFAGANEAWMGQKPRTGVEDGILTAEEASQLHLDNTRLVVLSACETGLGEIRADDSVYGLQRAFRLAGAQQVLMSLWSVNKQATLLLMDRFYDNWLNRNMPVRPALEEAQGWLRKQEGYENPYFWAGFVLIGLD